MGEIRGATWGDFDGVFELLNVRSREPFGISELDQAYLRRRWELPAFDVGRDNWVSVEAGRITGYAALDSTQALSHAATDPAVGDALLARAEERGRERSLDRVSCIAAPQDKPLHALVVRNGFVLDREIWRMWRALNGDVPEPVWPEGVSVRTYENADASRVHGFLDDAYAGWDPNYIARGHEDWLAVMTGGHDWFDPALWFVAERAGELVGCALQWKEGPGGGWVKDIVVGESERGRGLGTALLQHAFRAYAERGVKRVGLKVDSTNPTGATRLYKRVGFVIDRRYGIWMKRL